MTLLLQLSSLTLFDYGKTFMIPQISNYSEFAQIDALVNWNSQMSTDYLVLEIYLFQRD